MKWSFNHILDFTYFRSIFTASIHFLDMRPEWTRALTKKIKKIINRFSFATIAATFGDLDCFQLYEFSVQLILHSAFNLTNTISPKV